MHACIHTYIYLEAILHDPSRAHPKLGIHLVPTFPLTQALLEARQQGLAVVQGLWIQAETNNELKAS